MTSLNVLPNFRFINVISGVSLPQANAFEEKKVTIKKVQINSIEMGFFIYIVSLSFILNHS